MNRSHQIVREIKSHRPKVFIVGEVRYLDRGRKIIGKGKTQVKARLHQRAVRALLPEGISSSKLQAAPDGSARSL